jgi:poly(A) polymerase/tRNA nucleotidyltransferase (CCA-adding enzyme)
MRDEFQKILLSPVPSTGLRLLEETGLLTVLLPELAAARGCQQKGLHRFDVMDHLFHAVDAAPKDEILRLAALFHDAGKPVTKAEGPDGVPTFYGHEVISERIAASALKRLRFPNDEIGQVRHLIAQHMFNYEDSWTDAAVRRLVSRVGMDALPALFSLRRADAAATQGLALDPRSTESLERRIAEVVKKDTALKIKDLAIGGEDLAALGIPRGPVMGRILQELFETVLDDPEQNQAERLKAIAGKIKTKYGVE